MIGIGVDEVSWGTGPGLVTRRVKEFSSLVKGQMRLFEPSIKGCIKAS